jgi:tetratricopeptide (TPR) repeat protein
MSRFRSGAGALHMTNGAYSGRRPVGPSFDPLRCSARAAAGVELDVAEQICDRAVRESEGDADALMARGFLRFKQAQYERAQEDFAAALRSRPDLASALLGRGVLRLRAGDAGGGADIERARMLDSGVAAYEAAGLRPP